MSAAQHLAEADPLPAVEPHQLHLLDRIEVGRRSVDLDAGQLSGHPRYLAMYDLTHPQVLDSPEYLKVAFANSSPWTLRILQRVRVYRAFGRQIYPGNALTGTCARVELPRFRNRPASAAEEIVSGMRANFEKRPETAQVRVFAYEDRGSTDFIGLSSSECPAWQRLIRNRSVRTPQRSIWRTVMRRTETIVDTPIGEARRTNDPAPSW